jgi:hypothetical protein
MASLKHSVYWQKLYYIVDELEESTSNLLCTDIDIVIRNEDYQLESILAFSNRDILISSDPWGMCAGFMMIRNTPWSKSFFKQVIRLGEVDKDVEMKLLNCSGKREQSTMKYLYTGFSSVSERFFLLSEDIVSCPVTKSPTAPFHHYWLDGGEKYRRELVEDLTAMQ